MEQKYKWTDLFLTHNWGKGNDNHARVSIINEYLNRMGYSTWFDSQRMEGDIREKMEEGINFTRCVVVFVTAEYIRKLDSGKKSDNCLFEFNKAIQKLKDNKCCDPNGYISDLHKNLGHSGVHSLLFTAN